MAHGSQLVYALLLAIPVACIVWTVTQEEVFRELRDSLCACQRRNDHSLWRRKLAYVPTCPYCLSHYVAVVFVLLFDFRMLAADWRGYVVSILAVVLASNVYLTAYNLLRVRLRRSRALADYAEKMVHRAGERRSAVEKPRRRRRERRLSKPNGRVLEPVGRNGRSMVKFPDTIVPR